MDRELSERRMLPREGEQAVIYISQSFHTSFVGRKGGVEVGTLHVPSRRHRRLHEVVGMVIKVKIDARLTSEKNCISLVVAVRLKLSSMIGIYGQCFTRKDGEW